MPSDAGPSHSVSTQNDVCCHGTQYDILLTLAALVVNEEPEVIPELVWEMKKPENAVKIKTIAKEFGPHTTPIFFKHKDKEGNTILQCKEIGGETFEELWSWAKSVVNDQPGLFSEVARGLKKPENADNINFNSTTALIFTDFFREGVKKKTGKKRSG